MKKPAPESPELYWFAGLFEGEGSSGRSGTLKGRFGTFTLTMGQKDPWVLYRVQGFFGGSVRGPYGKVNKFYSWYLGGRNAEELARRMAPLLSPRRILQMRKHGLHV